VGFFCGFFLSFCFLFFFFFFNDTATTEIYTLSLHDALPIYNEGPIVAEEPVFATAQALSSGGAGLVNSRVAFGSPRPCRERGTVRVRWCG